jgi:hypothetical protein
MSQITAGCGDPAAHRRSGLIRGAFVDQVPVPAEREEKPDESNMLLQVSCSPCELQNLSY